MVHKRAVYARVIVAERTHDGAAAFDYMIPPELIGRLSLGAGVAVPFGKKVTHACVTSLLQHSERATKQIIDVLPREMWPGEELCRLALWVAGRYMCGVGVALRAVLIGGARVPTQARYSLSASDAQATLTAQPLIELLRDGPKTKRSISRALGATWQEELQSSIRAGLVVETEEFKVKHTAKKTAVRAQHEYSVLCQPEPELTDAQHSARTRIVSGDGVFVLFGVTASGKTEVYLKVVEQHLERGRGAIVLIPEIALTPQTVGRFKQQFGEQVAVLHSGLSQGERHEQWLRIRSGAAKIAVGPRSCVFAPVKSLSLVVIDEEHDRAYKQQEEPKYHAREVAIRRASSVVLGSATPSLESFHKALTKQYNLIEMPDRLPGLALPSCSIVDMRAELASGNRSIFSEALTESLKERLDRKEQAVLFLNRRGYATFLLCRECGHVIRCPWCDVSGVLHVSENRVRCHYCNWSLKAPDRCPECGSSHIRQFGTGTEKVAAEVSALFPGAKVLRMDRDTTSRRGSHEAILTAFQRREADVLVGTQMISKGHDLHGVSLVGIINADTALNMPDFRSSERTFQLIAQVSGRAGRGEQPGEVVIQTYCPGHYAIRSAATLDYRSFYDTEIRFREELGYPPFGELLAVSIRGKSADECRETGSKTVELLTSSSIGAELEVLGPAPCQVSRVKRVHRWQILIKSRTRAKVREAGRILLRHLDTRRVLLDVDPEHIT